jgi:hypothetical protein
MGSKGLLSHVLDDESLTRGLADPEARMLVEWLVAQVERLSAADLENSSAEDEARRLCRMGRSIGRFVCLWCHVGSRGAALQLASAERFHWPLPVRAVDPCELMESILNWEARSLGQVQDCAYRASW